jgi:flagellar operon protein
VSDLIPNPALLPPGGAVGAPAPAQRPGPSQPPSQIAATGGPSFADVLAERTDGTNAPTFSKHALDRLARRGIEMNTQTLGRLTQGIQRAADKGARNSVVFVDGTAFVTSVKNNTVITAVTPEAMNSHVFTNIDSAVIA